MRILAWILCASLAALTMRVAYIELVRGDYLEEMADELHNRERTLESKRGDIVDRNGTVLATSGSICRVSVVHNQIQDAEHVAKKLAEILGLEYEKVLEKVQKRVALQIIKNQVSVEEANQIRAENLTGVIIDENYDRYYPYGSMAAQTIGFVGSDNQGVVGLEVAYDQYLQGLDGRILSLTDARGITLEDIGEKLEEGAEGHVLQTTLDVRLQQYAEQLIEKAVTQKNAKKGALIAMNPQNGEIYAMALYPSYDLNDPFSIQDEALIEQWESMEESQQMDALNQMWRNWCINDTYEPGSTFKIVTASAALEEAIVGLDETFHCGGSLVVADRKIRCHKAGGHGTVTFLQGIQESCNPVFMTLALRLGSDRFYEYLKIFQFDQKTGIDVPGEASGIMHKPENVGPVELATMGFGQSLTITPIQLLRAGAAIVNGGDLITPHFGKAILNESGEVLKELTYETEEQAISAQTSETMRLALETVVSEGGGKKASIPGYRIGGKTATSQKLPRSAHQYISSFLGFAPVDNPQIMVLCLVDEPQGIYYGGTVCAPIVKEFLENALPYLGIEADYSLVDENSEPEWGEEPIGPVGYVPAPDVMGMSFQEAKKAAEELELTLEALGSGEVVAEQFPQAGEEIRKGTKLIVYLKGESTNDDRKADGED
ncbi:MAG: PASTA domain-containing protein [Lachnospiraceae bacterium]|nr:PASTA domain-containing protein [Lachnospiraceae bacterium]